MTEAQLELIFKCLTALSVVAIILAIVGLIVLTIFLPIIIKDKINKTIEERNKELNQINAAIAAEYDNHKRLTDEVNKLRRQNLSQAQEQSKTEEEHLKLKLENEKLLRENKELKKQQVTKK